MRYPAPEKLEIIRLVEQSHLPVRTTLDKLGITRATFYRWYDAYRRSGPEALADRPSRYDPKHDLDANRRVKCLIQKGVPKSFLDADHTIGPL